MKSIEDAIQLAVEVHRGQKDKGGLPYILHPLEVMGLVKTHTAKMVALLHDVVEDSDYTIEELREMGYPPEVVDAVDVLTHRPDESYEAYVRRIRPHPLARQVKLADLTNNMDVRRLPELREKDVERLRRYQRAWRTLNDTEEAPWEA